MSNYLRIRNLRLFSKSIRKNSAMVFPKSYFNQIDNLISVEQTYNLALKYLEPGYDGEFIISQDNHDLLSNEIKKWIYNRSLSIVASSGGIECIWDDDANEMFFWHPESNETFNTVN